MYYRFDIHELEANIDNLSLDTLIKSQILTVKFCKDYILNPDIYAFGGEDHFTLDEILLYQRHLKMEDF
jgi:hypothetical protein